MEYTFNARVTDVAGRDRVTGTILQIKSNAKLFEIDSDALFNFLPVSEMTVTVKVGEKDVTEIKQATLRPLRTSRTKEGHFMNVLIEGPHADKSMKAMSSLLGQEVSIHFYVENDPELFDEATEETLQEILEEERESE